MVQVTANTHVVKELEGIRAALAVPSYGPIDPILQKNLRVAVMNASYRGATWVGDMSPDRMDFATARNSVAQSAYPVEDLDGVVWVDSDIDVPPLAISRLLHVGKEYDFVTGVYHKRKPPHEPVFYHYIEDFKKFFAVEQYPEDSLLKAGGCGFGFVWTSRKLIRDIAHSPGFDPKRGWFPDDRHTGGFGEDMSFCYQAMQAGHQLWVDTGIQVGHAGEANIVWRKDYLACWDKIKEEGGYRPDSNRWGNIEGKE